LRLSARRALGDVISFLVFPSRDVSYLHAEETLLEPAHLFQVGLHVFVLGHVTLVGEVNEELGVALYGYALDPEGDRGPEASDEPFVLGDVVGDLVLWLETELHGVV